MQAVNQKINEQKKQTIETLRQTGDVRYDYTVPGPKPGEMVTIIGIQNQDTINYVEGTYENMLSGELDKDTAIRKTTHP